MLPRSIAATTLRGAVRAHFPDVIVSHLESLAAIRSESVSNQRSTASLLALLAGLGLLLGVAGVYGVIAHRAQRRTREMGIRLALGASAGQVIGMVPWETLLVPAAGRIAGVAAAFAGAFPAFSAFRCHDAR
jgi:ABC-type antimicrobial peptide transport system permease subunit